MTLFFLYAIAMQYNDPDPWLWMGVYGAAFALSIASVFRRSITVAALLIGLATLAFALWYVPRVLGKQHLFDSEEGREMLGLFITSAWLLVLAFRARRTAQRPAA
jgi:hypothetical protein